MEKSKPVVRQKKIKEFDWNPWEDLGSQRPNITYKQLFEIAPTIKAQIKSAITQTKPAVRFEVINQAEE